MTSANTPFQAIGGAPAIRRLADAFYDLMDSDAQYAQLRALHATDLAPMRESLAGYLTVWLGGPRDWLETRKVTCLMSMHRDIRVTRETAAQWTGAMRQALENAEVAPPLSGRMQEIFAQMAEAMVRD